MNKFLYQFYQSYQYKRRGFRINPTKITKELLESQYWSRQRMSDFQRDKLNSLVKFAFEKSEYYKHKLANCKLTFTKPEEVIDFIPVIRKKDIIENMNGLRTPNYVDNYIHSTSGSSGDPLSVAISEMAEIYRKATFLRFKRWWGIEDHEKSVLVWRYNRDNEKGFSKFKTIMRSRYDVNVYNLGSSNIHSHFNYIEKFRPVYIRGYCSGVVEFARLMKENGLRFKKAKLKVAIVTSEVLYPEDRKLMESVFGCKVANEYGSADGGLFAYECKKGNMHINEESVYLNTRKETEVVVTELFNDSMPIINYLNDDHVTISEDYCECGVTSRYIEEVIGRYSGFIIKSDGTKINQGILIDIFARLGDPFPNAVKKFKVYQDHNNLTIQLIPMEDYSISFAQALKSEIYSVIDTEFNVEINLVDTIELQKSGKNVYFVNLNN